MVYRVHGIGRHWGMEGTASLLLVPNVSGPTAFHPAVPVDVRSDGTEPGVHSDR